MVTLILAHTDNLNASELPAYLIEIIEDLGKKASNEAMNNAILQLCSWKELTIRQLASIMNRNDKYLFGIITPLRESGKLEYTIPDMPNHPEQAYKTAASNE